MFAAVGSFRFSFTLRAHADEPVKPTASASEANPAVPAPGHSVHGEAFNDGPRHAAHLIPGMGKVHFPVTTTKPEAQKFVDQGVAQLHSFYYFESERSFRQAAKIDPACAMAYWGMAMSNINNPRRAKGFIKEARKKAAGHQSARVALSGRARVFHQGWRQRPSPAAGLAQGARVDRAGFPRRHRCPSLAGDGDLAKRDGRDRQPPGRRRRARYGASSRADASGSPPLPHSSLGRSKSPSVPRNRRRFMPRPPRALLTPGTCPATLTPS